MSKRNEHKPGYKHTPLGWIPEEWEVKTLSNLITLISGFHLEPNDYNLIEEGIPYFSGPSDYTNEINVVGKWTTTSRAIAEKDDLLITVKGSGVGTLHLLKLDSVAIGRQIMAIRTSYPVMFFYFFLASKEYQFQQLAKGNLIPGISRKDILTLALPFPSKLEVNKIAEILSTWDEAIQKTQGLLRALRERNRGLVQALLTGKKRLKGFSGEWKRVTAKEVFRSVSIKNSANEQLLSATQDKGIIPRSQLEARVTMPSGETSSFKLVEKGDFVISLRSFQGGIEYSDYRGLVSPAYTVLKPTLQIDNDYYKFYFKSADFISRLSVAVIGIRDGKQISFDDFSSIRIPQPGLEEQKKIAIILKAATEEIQKHEHRLEALQQQKKSLMQKLLTGEVRVRV